jgi:hypothetical protein
MTYYSLRVLAAMGVVWEIRKRREAPAKGAVAATVRPALT